MSKTINPTTDIEKVRGLLASMIGDGRSKDALDLVVGLLETMRDKNSRLELRLRKLLKDKYGRKGEGITSKQLSLLLGELGQVRGEETGEEDTDPDKTIPIEVQTISKKKKRKAKPHGRSPLPEHLPREEIKISVEGEQRICTECGNEKELIGYDKSEVLEFVPAHFIVQLFLREKLACKPCGDGVVVAPAANKVIEKGLPGPGLLAELLVNKYRDSLPLYRQAQRYLRLGVKIPRSTLSGWNAAATDLLAPLVRANREQVLSSYILQADATGMKVLDPNHEANIKRGSLWCYVGNEKFVHFEFTPNQSKEGPHAFLAKREGYIVADAAPVFDGLFTKEGSLAIEVGCMMHCRRKFIDALDGGDLRAAYPIDVIKKLYKVEERAKQARAGPGDILRLRQDESLPLLCDLGKWIASEYDKEPPKSPLAKAMGYAVRQWEALKRFTEDGRLPIDNGAVERMIRVVAVGRKNYLFAGSDAGGKRMAIAYTLLCSCDLVQVDPWAYLKDVFEKLANGWPQKRIEELLPFQWAEAHPEHRIYSKENREN